MAIAFEGFSIREYALKMRSVDVEKSWPFDGDRKEDIERLLPPLTRKKHRWWSKELEVIKSKIEEEIKPDSRNESGFEKPKADLGVEKVVLGIEEERLVMVCPVCKNFTATTVNAVNAHIDSCLAQASREERRQMRISKTKSKAPKKRSIAEIFATAPQIEAVELEYNEGGEEEKDFPENGFDLVENKKRKKNKVKEVEEIVKNLKSKKKTKMKKTTREMKSLKKEKTHKLNGSSPLDFSGQIKASSSDKRSAKDMSDTVSIPKRKSSIMKSSSVQNKLKISRTPKYPVHSILKNQRRVVSGQKSSAISSIQGDYQTNPHHVQRSNRHVRFSGKDYILGPAKKKISSIGLPQTNSVCEAFSDSVEVSLVNGLPEEGNQSLCPEVNGSHEVVAVNVMNGMGVQSANEKESLEDDRRHTDLPTFANPNSSSCQEKEKSLLVDSVDKAQDFHHCENFQMFNQGSSSASCSPSCAIIPRLLDCNSKGVLNPNVEVQANGIVEGPPNAIRSLTDPFSIPMPRSSAMGSLSNTDATSKVTGGHPHQSQTTTQNSNNCALQYQQFFHLSPVDLMPGMCSSVEWNKQETAMCRDKCIDEDFIGLPLNSQGELIKLNSSGKGGLNEPKNQNTMMGSSSSFLVQNLVEPNNIMDHPNVKESPQVHVSSRGNNHSIRQLGLDLNLMNISSCGCGQYKQTRDLTEKEKFQLGENSDHGFLLTTQPTMRLMGIDVAVGRSNEEVQGIADGKKWTDKEIIGGSRHFQQELIVNPVLEKSKDATIDSLEPRSNPISPIFSQMKSLGPRSSRTYLNQQRVPQNGPSPRLPSQGLMNRTLKFPETRVSGTKSSKLSSQIPVQAPTQNPCQHMVSSSAQFGCNQNLANGAKSAFQFPFASHNSGLYVQPSWLQSSSQSLPQWMLTATQQKEMPFSAPQSEANVLAITYPYHSSTISNPNNPNSSIQHTQNSAVTTSLPQRPLIPVPPGFKPTSAIHTSCRNRTKVKGGTKSNFFRIKAPDLSKKAKKWHAEMPVNSSAVMGLNKRAKFNGCTKYNTGSPKLDTYRDIGRGVEYSQMDIHKDGFKIASGFNSSNVDGAVRSGPIKLSAGAKHILKPSQNTDQDHLRPTYSTIPYRLVTNSAQVSEIQKKSAKSAEF